MIHGVINVYKEQGFTSHDVVAKLRGIVGQKKIGHTGTLDPDAVGVLPVCLGRATKLCDMLTDKEQVRAAVLDFVGDYNQVPPMYSALKINGKKLYELAREGKIVERAARRVQIFDIEILSIALPRVTMKVHCSKGTYIRTLCHDIGQKLGCGACMEKLTRTKVSRFEIKDSLTLAQIEVLKKEDRLSEILIPIDQMFADYPSIIVSGEAARLAYNGNGIKDRDVRKDENILDEAYVRVYDDVEDFIGVYQYHEKEREYRIRKMFYIKEEK